MQDNESNDFPPDADESIPYQVQPTGYRRSPTLGKLMGALATAMASIGPAEKDATNPHFKSKYATLASCHAACIHALTGQELAFLMLPDVTPEVVKVTGHLHHSSDEWIESVCIIPHQGDAHSIGSAMTYAKRYLYCMVGVVADDDDDGNGAIGRPAAGQPREPRRTPPAPEPKPAPKEAPAASSQEPARKSEPPKMNPAMAAFVAGRGGNGESARVVDPEPLTEEQGVQIKGLFVQLRYGGTGAKAKVLEVTGKDRANLTFADGEKLLNVLSDEARAS